MIAHPQKVRVKHITSKNGSFRIQKRPALCGLSKLIQNKLIKRTESTQFPEIVPKSSIYLNPKTSETIPNKRSYKLPLNKQLLYSKRNGSDHPPINPHVALSETGATAILMDYCINHIFPCWRYDSCWVGYACTVPWLLPHGFCPIH